MEQPTQQSIQQKTETKPPTKINVKLFGFVTIVAIILVVGGILLLRAITPAPPTQQFTGETGDEADVDKNSSSVRFAGEVLRGQTFEREIGRGLVFRLISGSGGFAPYANWVISIGDKADPESDFTRVVNSPYRGIINHIYIAGWHFRNADNSGPNDGSTNAPQEVREFYFVLNRADAEEAARLLDKILWPATERGWKELDKNLALHKAIPKGEGVLTITDMKLGNLTVGEQAWIEEMKFEVELTFPEDSQEIDTSDWQTYRNSEFGFEVRYPSDWRMEHQSSGYFHFYDIQLSEQYKRAAGEIATEGFAFANGLRLMVYAVDESFEDFIQQTYNNPDVDAYGSTIREKKDVFFPNGMSATYIDYEAYGVVAPVMLIKSEKYVYEFSKYHGGSFGLPKYSEEEFEQILSTFRFVE